MWVSAKGLESILSTGEIKATEERKCSNEIQDILNKNCGYICGYINMYTRHGSLCYPIGFSLGHSEDA